MSNRKMYIITIKLPRNPKHNKSNKIIGKCPLLKYNGGCTDVTGEHHSFIGYGYTPERVKEFYSTEPYNYHITRIEECDIIG